MPVLFLLVVYFMAGLKHEADAFFLTVLTTFLCIAAAQGLGLAIGATLMDLKKATTLAFVTVMTFMLAGGYFVKKVSVFISWLRYLSYNYQTYKLLLKVQYKEKNNWVDGIKLGSSVKENVSAGFIGDGAVLNRGTTINKQYGVALVNQGIRSSIDAGETVQVRKDQQKNLPTGIPAATEVDGVLQVGNPSLDATNATGLIERKAATLIAATGVAKHPAALVDIAEKPTAPTTTTVQQTCVEKRDGQVLAPAKPGHALDASGKSVTSHLEKVAAQDAKEEDWTVVR
ncbi:abc transporter g family member 27 [Nicotiana attenuata]|uniref:Abc transporter g family member 27 n=1 Tax=Nicotiana attenuata TaxID=49451 RepID=A0A314KLK8_NICAT|nr:abc transporter g family member 27 [Nicotiana attenuata]